MKKLPVLILLLLACHSKAANLYWYGNTSTNFSTASNWSTSSGSYIAASAAPGASDVANFGSYSANSCVLSANTSIAGMIMSGYTGTFKQSTFTFTIGSSGATLSSGTFVGGNVKIVSNGAFSISGTAFTSTSDTLFAANGFTVSSGSFTHNSGTVCFTATQTWSVSNTGGSTFNKVSFKPTASATVTITSTTNINVTGQVSLDGSSSITLNSGTINVSGNIISNNSATAGGGSALLNINGSGAQSLTGNSTVGNGIFPKITIAKSAGTLTLANTISVGNNWTWTSGSLSLGTSVVAFTGTLTISGNHSLGNVTFSSGTATVYTLATGTTLTVSGTLAISGSGNLTFNSGVISVTGNTVTLNNSGTGGGGTTTFSFSGTGPTLTCPSTSGQCVLPAVTFTCSSATTFTIASGTYLTVAKKLILAGSANLLLATGNINAKDSITVTNTATGGGGSATIIINGSGSQCLTGNGTAGQGRLPKISINKTSGTLALSSVISVGNDWTYTQGTVVPGTSQVVFYNTTNVDGQGASTTMRFGAIAIGGGTSTLTGNLAAIGNLTIASGTTLVAGNKQLNVGGSFSAQGTWQYDSSTVVLDTSGYKQITGAAASVVTFYNLTLNKAGTTITLARPVKVNHTLTLTRGRFKTTTTNYLELAHTASCSGGSNTAYVHGPVRKTGNAAFIFPLGDSTLSTPYHPLGMSAPSAIGDQFEAQYKITAQGYGSALVDSLQSLSSCQYWTLERKAGTSTPTVSLGWNSNCNNGDYAEMRVALWNGTLWSDLGQASVSVSGSSSGTVTSSVASAFTVNPAPLTIAYQKVNKSYAVLSKTPAGGYYTTDGAVLSFGFDEEYKDANNLLTYSVTRISTDRSVTLINNSFNLASVSYGNNLYKIDLYDSGNTPLASGYYMLEVTNEKNEKWYLRFKI